MSGIAVLYQWDGAPADRSTVERMIAVIPYRSVDGFGIWGDGPVAIGHAKLATTPEASAETSPFVDESSGLVLSMDGRVDNRDELTAELNSRGHRVRTGTDAEIVLRSWQCWGAEAPARVIGDFAFALWDPSKRTLFCARDPMGVKSFYYFNGPGFFLCASEIHQLFQDPRVLRRPNEPAIAEILVRTPFDREETLFEGVRRLEPAHYLSVSARGVECHQYYFPDASREIVYRSDDDYSEHFFSLLKEAVRCRLRSSRGVESDLSGGLDSSSIVCLTEQLRQDGEVQLPSFETFSVPFGPGPAAETEYVEEVIHKYPHRHTYLLPGIARLSQLNAQVAHYLDLPDFPNCGCTDYTSILGNRNDLRVRLCGLGGDEWFTGTYLVYADLLSQFRFAAALRRLRINRNPPPGFFFPGYTKVLAEYGVWPLVQKVVPNRLKSALRQSLRPPKLHPLVMPAFAARTKLLDRLSARWPLPSSRTFTQQDMFQTYLSGQLPYGLEMDGRWTARFRLEARHPFLDRRIMEFAFAIPDNQRFRPGVSKFVLRNSMRGILPEKIRRRSDKSNLSELYPMAMIALGGERLFDRLNIVQSGWVDGVVLRRLYRSMAEAFSRRDPSYEENILELWKVFAVELWFSVVFLGISEPFKHLTGTTEAA
ncbi:MAG: asparagine synthase-related protein [Candidatus Binatus sp.]|uniref:asparagine synthase-related protein n=1 Tax=Candidatus Binatus sp. TaxID=2811406 RepID=UPI003BB11060